MWRNVFLSGLMLSTAALASRASAADDAVVVANRAAPLPAATQAVAPEPEPQFSSRISDRAPEPEINDEGQIVYRLPRSQSSAEPPVAEERRVRGSAGASIGTGGYRSGYVAGQFPVGETGTVGVVYGETDYGDNAVFMPYDGYGGYGRMSDPLSRYDDYSGYRSGSVVRGGKHRSLAVSVDFGNRVSAGVERSQTCGSYADEAVRAWDDPVDVPPYGMPPKERGQFYPC